MALFRKVIFSFALSVLLFAGIAVFSYSGNSAPPLRIAIFIALFLTLFLIVFFCFSLRRDSGKTISLVTEEASAESAPVKSIDIPHFIDTVVETEAASPFPSTVDDDYDAAELADIPSGTAGIFRQLFDFSQYNPALLAEAEHNVIYEQNGIHYISDNVFDAGKSKDGKLDSSFMELIESVVGKS